MKVFDSNRIKNIVLVGGAKSGKTTLAETMLFEANLINRRGTIENKNTISDFHEIEHERGMSVFATPLHTEWRNYKINIVDTPGLDDFVGEIVSSLRVADTCVMLINAQNGVEVGTELVWNHVDKYRKPVIFAVNQLDHANANFEITLSSINDHFGSNAVLMQYPVNAGKGFNCIIDLLKMIMYKFGPDGGKPDKLEIPDDQKEKVFGAFEQQSGQSNTKYGGTGLGLTISKTLTQMMGGRIWVESKYGHGSIFFFTAQNVLEYIEMK